MFVHYSGRGGLIPVITFATLCAFDFGCAGIYHNHNYYAQHSLPKLLSFWCSAFLVWLLHNHRASETIADAQGIRQHPGFFRDKDSFFFLSASRWPWALVLLGVLFFFVND